jgi:small subunit ribosomal protein S4e
MARGIKKHMKRVAAPSSWMLSKLDGVWAPKPNAGPHKVRECLPMCLLLRNRLKYALNYKETKTIMIQRQIKVDGKIKTDQKYPTGFMDVVTIDKTKENFRLLYDTKGRFRIHKISAEEATYKLCRVKDIGRNLKNIPYVTTHDGRTIRYPDPEIRAYDTVRVDIASGKILDYIKFEQGNVCMIKGGNSIGRVGVITHREKHPGSFEIVHLRDAAGHSFTTRLQNVMVIGKDVKSWVSLPKGDGIKLNVVEDRKKRMGFAVDDEVDAEDNVIGKEK